MKIKLFIVTKIIENNTIWTTKIKCNNTWKIINININVIFVMFAVQLNHKLQYIKKLKVIW
jgi:hypothetical protein